MSASNNLTRGPLPPGVYWRRRLVILIGAAVLVFVIAQLLTGGGDGKSGGRPAAQQAAAEITTGTDTTPSSGGTATGTASTGGTTATAGVTGPSLGAGSTGTSPLTLAEPSGPCPPSDITVTPQVDKAVAGSDVTVKLALQTKTTAACTWQLDQHDLAVKITRGGKVLWTSQQCASALPERSVVIRNVVPSIATMVWDSKVSTVGCRRGSAYVRPGTLRIWAATLGGAPARSDFDLVLPSQQTIAVTPKADPTPSTTPSGPPRR